MIPPIGVHHALGHARGTAGVEHVDVVLGPLDPGRRFVRRHQRLVSHGAVDPAGAHPIVDLDEHPELGQAAGHRGDPLAERRMEHEGLGVGVVEQVPQLLVEVAVVHVHRYESLLHAGELGLEVLGGVVEEQPDLGVGLEAVGGERRGQPGGALLVRRPRQPPVAVDDRRRVGHRVGDRLPHGRKVHLHAVLLSVSWSSWPTTTTAATLWSAHLPSGWTGTVSAHPTPSRRATSLIAAHSESC